MRIRCAICRRWFGRHDPLVLHGDGKTDDTVAIQHLADTRRLNELKIGRTYRTSRTIEEKGR